jgi:hypothetical protein
MTVSSSPPTRQPSVAPLRGAPFRLAPSSSASRWSGAPLLSYGPVLAAPGRLAIVVAGIVGWIVLAGGMFGVAAQSGSLAAVIVLGVLFVLPVIVGPLVLGRPMHVEVGPSAIATRWIWWSRAVPLGDVARVRIVERSIEVGVRGGPSLWLRPVKIVGRRNRLMYVAPEDSELLQALQVGHAGAQGRAVDLPCPGPTQ